MIEPYPHWWVYDDSKNPAVWTSLRPYVRAHLLGVGCKVDWQAGRFKIAPASGRMRLDNRTAAFAYGNQTWWAAPRHVVLQMGTEAVFRGLCLPISSEPVQNNPTVEWPLFGLTYPGMDQARPWQQMSLAAADSRPSAVAAAILDRYGFAAGAHGFRPGMSWMHPASVDPGGNWLLAYTATDGPLAADLNETGWAGMSIMADSLDGRIVLAGIDQAIPSNLTAPAGQSALRVSTIGTVPTAKVWTVAYRGPILTEGDALTFTVPLRRTSSDPTAQQSTVVTIPYPPGVYDIEWTGVASTDGAVAQIVSFRTEPDPSGGFADRIVILATIAAQGDPQAVVTGKPRQGFVAGSYAGQFNDADPYHALMETPPWVNLAEVTSDAAAQAYGGLISAQRRQARIVLPMSNRPTATLPQHNNVADGSRGQLIPGKVVAYGTDGGQGDSIKMLPLYIELGFDLDAGLLPTATIDGISYDQAPASGAPAVPIPPTIPAVPADNPPTDDEPPVRPDPREPMIVATLTNVEGVGVDFASTGFAVLDTGYFGVTGERKAFSTLIRRLRDNGSFDSANDVRLPDTPAIVGRPSNTTRGFNTLLWDSARQRYWVAWINRSGEGVTSDRLRAFLTDGTEVDATARYRTLNVFPVGLGTIGGGNIGTIGPSGRSIVMQRFFIRPFDPDRVDTDTLSISGLRDIGNGAGLGVYQRDVAGTITDFLVCMNDEGVLYTLTGTTSLQAIGAGATFTMPVGSLFAGFAIDPTTRDPNNSERQLAVTRIRLGNGQHRIETFWFTPPSTPQAGDAVIEQSTEPGSLWHMARQETQERP